MKEDLDNLRKDVDAIKSKSYSLAMVITKNLKKERNAWRIAFFLVFAVAVISIGFNFYYLKQSVIVESETMISQDSGDNGQNNYIGNDGDIIYGTSNN